MIPKVTGVSPNGEVIFKIESLPFYGADKFGNIWTRRHVAHRIPGPGTMSVIKAAWRKLPTHANPKGYLSFSARVNGMQRKISVHAAVCEAFNGARPGSGRRYHVCHIDGSRDNNNPLNLMWGTVKENFSHKRVHGTRQVGERAPSARLTTEAVLAIRKRFEGSNESFASLARAFGVSESTVSHIINRKTWSHI